MENTILFKTPGDAARAVRDLLVSGGHKVSARPYSPAKPDETEWWVVPSTEWPAYHHGKYYFCHAGDENTSKIFCGFNAEKGWGYKINELCTKEKSRRQIMGDDWQWHKFIENMADNTVAEAIAKISANSGQKVLLNVSFGKFDETTDYDPYNRLNEPDYYYYRTNGTELELLDNKISGKETNAIKECHTVKELAEALISISNSEWFWINIYIGLELTIAAKQCENTWKAFEIYKNVLNPFEKWFV